MAYYFLLQVGMSFIFFLTFDKNIELNFKKFIHFFFLIFLIIFTGLRYEVGGDWFIYNENFILNSTKFNFYDLSIRSDYGWELISFILSKLNFSYVSINLISSLFFFISLSVFTKEYNYKLLVFIVSFPIVILILLMGFTRQAVAFSFLLLSLNYLFKEKFLQSFIFILLGVFFHKSVILFLFLYLLFPTKLFKYLINNLFLLIFIFTLILITVYGLYNDFFQIYTQYFGSNISSNPESKGTYFRWLINFIPSIIFIFLHKKFNLNYIQKRVYLSFSFLIILSFFFINSFSTGIDRYLYYFTIIQIFVFSNLPNLRIKLKKHLIIGIILYHLLILYVWLMYSVHSYLWIPYKIYYFNI